MLRLDLGPHSRSTRVQLDGQDISRFVRRITLRCDVGEITTATIEYIGAVTVEGDAGRVTLTQGEHLVTCDTCRAVERGRRLADVDLDAIGEPVEPIPLPAE